MTHREPSLIVHTDWSKSWGGQEIRTLTELRGMRDQGFRCGLVVPEQSELARRGRDEGFTNYPVEFTSKFNISSWETEGIAQSFIQGLLYGLSLLVCRTPSLLEPLSCVQTYRIIDYDDLQAACSGLVYLSDDLQRDEEKVKV